MFIDWGDDFSQPGPAAVTFIGLIILLALGRGLLELIRELLGLARSRNWRLLGAMLLVLASGAAFWIGQIHGHPWLGGIVCIVGTVLGGRFAERKQKSATSTNGVVGRLDAGAGAHDRRGVVAITGTTASVTITLPIGLYAGPAVKLTKLAKSFAAEIRLRGLPDGEWADAKSIVKVMTLKLRTGAVLEMAAEGEAARPALAALRSLVERSFDDAAVGS
jgi:phosphocarrier protein